MRQYKPSRELTGRWLPAESVAIVSYQTINAQAAERSGRFLGNAAWQIDSNVAKAPNGDLLLMTVLPEPRHLVLLRSRDQGHTWSPPAVVWEYPAVQYFAPMAVLRSGRIVIIVRGAIPAKPEAENALLALTWPMYSDDSGTTWKHGPPITAPPFTALFAMPQLFEQGDGTVIMPAQGELEDEKGGKPAIWAAFLLRSRDGGITWGDASIVMQGDRSIGTEPNEISILPLRSGTWLAMFRMNWMKPSQWYGCMLCRSISRDCGRTWSTPRLVLGQTGYPCLQELPDGAVMVSGSGAFGVRYLISYDEGLTWAYEQVLESSGDADTTSTVLDDHTVFLVHGSGMGPPHYNQEGHPHVGYFYAGLRGRYIRKV